MFTDVGCTIASMLFASLLLIRHGSYFLRLIHDIRVVVEQQPVIIKYTQPSLDAAVYAKQLMVYAVRNYQKVMLAWRRTAVDEASDSDEGGDIMQHSARRKHRGLDMYVGA